MFGLPGPPEAGPADANLAVSRARLLGVAIETRRDTMVDGLEAAAAALDALPLPDDPEVGVRRQQIVRTIRSYLMPRVSDPGRPLTVVFAGPTGAGKSTLLNSLAGAELSETGPLRPTTRSPVVFANIEQAETLGNLGGVECDVVVGRASVLGELSLVDTPDIDSTSVEHRAMAEALIDVGDIVVFVTSALRYADLVPWEVLRRARSRGAPVICVLNRIRPDSGGAVHDYRRLLHSEGLGRDLLTIGEHHLPPGAFSVPSGSIRDLRRALMSEIASHRSDAEQIWRRVMATTLESASGLIAVAEEHSTRALLIESGIATPVDSDPLVQLGEYPPGEFPAGESPATLGSSKRSIRRWARRALPRGPRIDGERMRLTQVLISHVDAHLRRSGLDNKNGDGYTNDDHQVVRAVIEHWIETPIGAPVSLRGVDSTQADLLLKIVALSSSQWPRNLLELLAPGFDVGEAAGAARRSLRDALHPVHQDLTRRVSGIVASVAKSEDIDLARMAITGVIARVSFADA